MLYGTHVAQMIGYLNVTRLELALLLNFKNARLDWKRVVRHRESDERESPASCLTLIRDISLIRGPLNAFFRSILNPASSVLSA